MHRATHRCRRVPPPPGPRRAPAGALIGLYHPRCEQWLAYLALRHTRLRGRGRRSGDPVGLTQGTWALLAVYQARRTAVTDAVATAADPPPERPAITHGQVWEVFSYPNLAHLDKPE